MKLQLNSSLGVELDGAQQTAFSPFSLTSPTTKKKQKIGS
jgi:hypothetical protein